MFGNFITPATLLITCLVPLTLQEIHLPKYEKNSFKSKLRGIYYVSSLLATCSELICIIYASISSSRLLQSSVAPTTSVFALIQQDYELAWVATTVHFLGGLMGFLMTSGIGAYLSFPKRYNTAGACFAMAALLWVTRLANTRVVLFSGAGEGGNSFYLLKRYIILGTKQLQSSPGPNLFGTASVMLTVLAIILTVRALVTSKDE